MIFIYAIFVCLALYNLKPQKQIHGQAVVLSKDDTTSMKGICAICVILHHLGIIFNYTGILGNINKYLGGISVGVFFFLSAYGLVLQYKKVGRPYLKKVLFVKIPKLWLYLISTNLIYYFVFDYKNCGGGISDLLKILGLDWLNRPNPFAWFIYTILVIYVIFVAVYFLDKFFKYKHTSDIIMTAMPLLFAIIIFLIGMLTQADWVFVYAKCIISFPLGVLYAVFKSKIDYLVIKYCRYICVAALFIFIVCLQYFAEELLAPITCVLMIIMFSKVFISNPITMFLGKISLGLYLLHNLFIRLFESFATINYPYALAVLACSVASATLLTYLDILLSKGVSKLIKKDKSK